MTTAYSFDEETYTQDFEQMLANWAEQADLVPGMKYWEVGSSALTHAELISKYRVMNLLEDLDQAAFDEVGECFDNDYSGVSMEALKELQEVIQAWAEKHVNIGQYFVLEHATETVRTLTQTDLEGFQND